MLILADETGKSLMDARTCEENENIQFELSGDVGDRFQIAMILGRVEVTENFAI